MSFDPTLYFKIIDKNVEVMSRTFDKAAAYGNLMLLGGYAGAFTIWSFTKSQLHPNATIWVALLLGMSLVVFVLFEAFKMPTTTIRYEKAAKILEEHPKSLDPYVSQMEAVQRKMDQYTIANRRVWFACFWFSIVTALLAVAILFSNFLLFLLSGPIRL